MPRPRGAPTRDGDHAAAAAAASANTGGPITEVTNRGAEATSHNSSVCSATASQSHNTSVPVAAAHVVAVPPTPALGDPSPAVGLIPAQAAVAMPYHASPLRRFDRLPEYVSMYTDEIVDYLSKREQQTPRDPHYLSQQSEVTERMRTILVDWLVDVAIKFKLHAETFYVACDIVDRYLMVRPVTRATLQLVGVTAVLIAAKHEEIWPPEVRECVYITANSYQRDDILRMERDIADALLFRFAVPTPFPFLEYCLQCTGTGPTACHLAHYYLEYSALCYAALAYRPSRVAAACVLLANATEYITVCDQQGLTRPDTESLLATTWTELHARASRYADINEIVACARVVLHFAKTTAQEPRYRAIPRKYGHAQFGEVSTRFAFPEGI